ncbi:DUF86 domain-containing protein [Methanoplanus sp. FWC-SCC4]|uniref:DUF86 domain-containing protein n=1 Tax=Methanochimaera problematica TaxID=2609417 RepID=A0AA97FFH7_9EURY|nr:HepT-like ribonuclease domain-containing protein [Methanoplanus sp. FWC-SCC4]WOF17063.1 DUF86 domain-containing protein [Methanoplanus sp. FWC-SCC4]
MPQHEPEKYLYDIEESAGNIQKFVSGKCFEDYESDIMLKSAVERQFEIIGEALKQLFERNPQYKAAITNPSRIISFRNRLIHGYASISDEVVWGVIEKDLPILKSEIKTLLERVK